MLVSHWRRRRGDVAATPATDQSRRLRRLVKPKIRLSRDPAVWSSFVNEGTNHIVNRAVTRGNVGRGSKKTGLGRVDFLACLARWEGASDCDYKWMRVGR